MAAVLPGDSSQFGSNESSSQRLSQEKPEDGGRWYFSRKEIEENSPSRRDGLDLKKETYLRKSYCTFLQDLGMRLKVPQVTIATAIIFCHRFYLRQSHMKNDRRTIATACMFLAGKVEETPRPLKDVILVSYEIIHKKDPEAVQRIKQKEVYEQQKELILLGERVVLATLGFDLNMQHPYKPLVEAIKKFKVAQNALAQVAWNFVNDGLRTSLCLQFKPHHIAAGAIFLAAKFLKVKLPSDGEKVWWQEFDVTPRQLEEVSNQMLELYEQNRVPPSQGSEADGGTAAAIANREAAKSSVEEHMPNNNSDQSGFAPRPGPSKPSSANHVADHAQTRGNDYGSSGNLHDKAYSDAGEGQNGKSSSEWNGSEDSKERSMRVREGGEMKSKYVKEPLQTMRSPAEAIKKIDEDKLKELRAKRMKSRGDIVRRKDSVDEYDPIMKELEEGVELAAAEKKQSRPNENVEEGEVSGLDDSNWEYRSNDRKRKAGRVFGKGSQEECT